jgi:hypothetical protein
VDADDPSVRVVQTPTCIEVNGERLQMVRGPRMSAAHCQGRADRSALPLQPLVEKPFDGDNHNVYIYYGEGRGSRRLFRKVKVGGMVACPR